MPGKVDGTVEPFTRYHDIGPKATIGRSNSASGFPTSSLGVPRKWATSLTGVWPAIGSTSAVAMFLVHVRLLKHRQTMLVRACLPYMSERGATVMFGLMTSIWWGSVNSRGTSGLARPEPRSGFSLMTEPTSDNVWRYRRFCGGRLGDGRLSLPLFSRKFAVSRLPQSLLKWHSILRS